MATSRGARAWASSRSCSRRRGSFWTEEQYRLHSMLGTSPSVPSFLRVPPAIIPSPSLSMLNSDKIRSPSSTRRRDGARASGCKTLTSKKRHGVL